jgi:pyruvate,water dikinase
MLRRKDRICLRGEVRLTEKNIDFSQIKKPSSVEVMLIVGDPDKAFQFSFYPNDGVGLMRLEFIITHSVQIHPMALVKFSELKDPEAKKQILEIPIIITTKRNIL